MWGSWGWAWAWARCCSWVLIVVGLVLLKQRPSGQAPPVTRTAPVDPGRAVGPRGDRREPAQVGRDPGQGPHEIDGLTELFSHRRGSTFGCLEPATTVLDGARRQKGPGRRRTFVSETGGHGRGAGGGGPGGCYACASSRRCWGQSGSPAWPTRPGSASTPPPDPAACRDGSPPWCRCPVVVSYL